MIHCCYKYRFQIILGFIVFCVIFVFFAQIHPVYPYDADDWTYLHNWRDLYPSTTNYNPTRILPEILMPLCGELSMEFIYPIIGDITQSVCMLSSIMLASTISAYMLVFFRLLKKKFNLQNSDCLLITFLFLTFHFLLFMNGEWENQHLFYSFDLCCHYNYTIPNILASCMVLLFITDKFEFFSFDTYPIRNGFFVLLLYLTVLSHFFANIILISYICSFLIIKVCSTNDNKFKLLPFVSKYWLHLSIIALWLISVIFEVNGTRAKAIQEISNFSFTDALSRSLKNYFVVMCLNTNRLAISLIFVFFFGFSIISFHNKKYYNIRKNISVCFFAFIICSCFLVLLSAKTYPYYLLRLMTIYGAPFYLLIISFFCLAIIIKKNRTFVFVIPFLLLLIFSKMERYGNTYQDIQTLYIEQDIQGTYKISRQDILLQNQKYIHEIIQADKCGEITPTLHVPKFKQIDNWPLADYYGLRLGRFLYKYGFTSNLIKPIVIVEESRTQLIENGGTK